MLVLRFLIGPILLAPLMSFNAGATLRVSSSGADATTASIPVEVALAPAIAAPAA